MSIQGKKASKKTILFCLPYAGGSTAFYSSWKRYLHESIELFPVELAGRGRRAGEPLYSSFEEAVDDIFNIVSQYTQSYPTAFFGHSMGSWLVYEVCHKLKALNNYSPEHLFISAMEAPHAERSKRIIHNLEDHEFINEVEKLGGTPPGIFESKELYEFFIPILRADYRIVEMYRYCERKQKLNSKVTVFFGEDDDISMEKIFMWDEVICHSCDYVSFNGGHFYINDNIEKITGIINHVLVKP